MCPWPLSGAPALLKSRGRTVAPALISIPTIPRGDRSRTRSTVGPVTARVGKFPAKARSRKPGTPRLAISACEKGRSSTVSTRPASESGGNGTSEKIDRSGYQVTPRGVDLHFPLVRFRIYHRPIRNALRDRTTLNEDDEDDPSSRVRLLESVAWGGIRSGESFQELTARPPSHDEIDGRQVVTVSRKQCRENESTEVREGFPIRPPMTLADPGRQT